MQALRILALSQLILNFIALATTKCYAENKFNYIVVHDVANDHIAPWEHFKTIDLAAAQPKTLWHTAKKHFALLSLTAAEASTLKTELRAANGLVVLDEAINLPVMPTSIVNRTTIADSEFLNDVPLCFASVDKVDFVIIDTVIFPNAVELTAVDLTYGPNYVGNTVACNPHATWVSSIIVGKRYGIIPTGNRRIHNVAAFDCNGDGFPSYLISAFAYSTQYAQTNAANGRRTVINLSGGGGANAALDAAANAAVDAGIATFIAAGNEQVDACVTESPAEASKVCSVGATTPPGNLPASFTNWGPPNGCVKLYLPGDALTVGDVTQPDVTVPISGTSFSAPIGAALAGLELKNDMQATPAQIYSRMLARTIIVQPPANALFHQPMPIMLIATACSSSQLLFGSFTTSKSTSRNFVTWYNSVTQNNFCVTFQIASNKYAPYIGLRNAAQSSANIITLSIGVNTKKKKYSNYLQQDGKTLGSKATKKRLFSAKSNLVFKIEVLNQTVAVSYSSASGDPVPLLFAKFNSPSQLQEIAFSGNGPGVRFTNVFKC